MVTKTNKAKDVIACFMRCCLKMKAAKAKAHGTRPLQLGLDFFPCLHGHLISQAW